MGATERSHAEMLPYYQWAVGDDSGMSSKTIVQATTGAVLQRENEACAPSDTADIGRCVRVLRKFPELRARLHLVADKAREWPALLANWDELERLYDAIDAESEDYMRSSYALYNRMNELAGFPIVKLPAEAAGVAAEVAAPSLDDAREQQARAGAVDKLRGEVEMDEWRKKRGR